MRVTVPSRARWLACLLFLLLPAATLTAHSFIHPATPPASAAAAYEVRNPQVSQVYYTPLPGPHARTWFRFTGSQGDVIHFNAGIPFIERLATLSVRVALIGPGMSEQTPADIDYGRRGESAGPEVEELVREVSSDTDLSAISFEEGDERRVFHEHFTDTVSWIIVQADVRIPMDGTYYLVVWPATALPPGSKLWLAIGVKERFTLYDIFRIGYILRSVRSFHEN